MPDPPSSPVRSFTPERRYTGPAGWLYRLKDWMEGLAKKRHAVTFLFILAVCESIFFPIPVDVLLIALCVLLPARSFWFATVCTVGSVLGAFGGYAIGHWLWYTGPPGAESFSALAAFFFNHVPGFTETAFEALREKYLAYDFWIVFTGGFTPLPFKLFTISAGVFNLSLPGFILASIVSRGGRFFLVAALFHFFGAPIKAFIDRYLGWLTIAFVILLVGGFVALKYVL